MEINIALSEFHRILEQFLMDLHEVTAHLDDIIIPAESLSECRLTACLKRLQKYKIHVNNSKYQFVKEKNSYLDLCNSTL